MVNYGPASSGGLFHIGHRPFGRRCVILLLLGGVWLTLGIGIIAIPVERFSRPGPGGPLQFLDTPPWPGALWIVGGVFGLAGGIFRPWQRDDAYGFLGLAIPPFVWTLLYLWSWLASLISADYYGRPTGWLGGLIYFAVSAIVLFIANWPDPNEPWTRVGASHRRGS